MKKRLMLVAILFFVLSVMASASTIVYYEQVTFDAGEEKIKVEICFSSSTNIVKARLDYWWDDVVHTYPFPKENLNKSVFNATVYFDDSMVPIDKIINFRFAAEDGKGERIERYYHYYPSPNWENIPWEKAESEHVILYYKLLKDEIAKQILAIAEDAYLGVSHILGRKLDSKISVILNTCEQIYCESPFPYTSIYYDTVCIKYEPMYALFPASLKRGIAHEMTHLFQDKFKTKTSMWSWFDQVMAQYVGCKVAFGDAIIDEVRKNLNKERFVKSLSREFWAYDLSLSVLFFEYLFDKYDTKDINEVVTAFIKSGNLRNEYLPKDFISYISSLLSTSLDFPLSELGTVPLDDIGVCGRIPSQYNKSGDKIVVRLYVIYLKDMYNDIGIVDLDNMSITNLTNNHLYEISPIWSRDEKNIYYVLEIGSECSIAQMRLEDRNIKRLYTCENFILDLSLSPDGEKIIFSSLYDLYHSSLWILNLKDGTVKQITSGQYLDTSPVFYTDNEILFISNRIDDEGNIFRMKLDEGQPYLIPGSTDSYKIINTSDSRCLFYTVNKSYFSGNYYVIDLDNGRVERYFDEDILDIWFPLLRDGKLIYFRGDNLKNIVREEITLD
jgi:hypothetical protein